MTIQNDIEVLKRILTEPGKWLVIVHLGHIVKVAKVEPEQNAKELARAFPRRCLVMLRRARAKAHCSLLS